MMNPNVTIGQPIHLVREQLVKRQSTVSFHTPSMVLALELVMMTMDDYAIR